MQDENAIFQGEKKEKNYSYVHHFSDFEKHNKLLEQVVSLFYYCIFLSTFTSRHTNNKIL